MLAGDQLGQVFALLRLAAVAAELVDAEIGMRAIGQADGRGSPRNLLQRDAMLEIAEPCPAIFLLDRDAMQPERADLRPEVARKLIALVDLGGARRDLIAGEIVNGFANCVRGFAEVEIEDAVRVGNHGRVPPANQTMFETALFARFI